MSSEELKEILKNGSSKAKHEAIAMAKPEMLNTELFQWLFELLEDDDAHNRFFAIFHLIEKFPKSFVNIEGSLIDDVYNLLFDQFAPVVDRATWALSIIGDKALDKLISEYYAGTVDAKTRIIYAIGRGYFGCRTKDRIQVLLDGLQSNSQDLRFTAMCEIMPNMPVSPWAQSEWHSTQDKSIDFEEIYDKVLPVAKEFALSDNENFKDFSIRYINWIENNRGI